MAKLAVRGVLVCFACIVTLLALTAAVSTATMEVLVSEHTHHLPDNPLVNALFVAALVAVLWVCLRTPRLAGLRAWLVSDKGFRIARTALLALVFALACGWLLALRPLPASDQESAWRIARDTLAGDWSEVDKGGYLSAYPFQIGIVLVLRCFIAVFGDHAVLAFQLSNAVALVVLFFALGDLMARFGAGRLQQLVVVVAGVLFFPLLQYVTFVYGTLWGLALIVLAMRFELDFFRTLRARYAVLCALATGLSMLCKDNYKVFLIAMMLVALLELVVQRKLVLVVLPIALVVALAVQSVVPRAYVERESGLRMADGCSPWSYLAMGLQESYADCGWFSEYNIRTYREAGDDTAKQARVAKAEFEREVQVMASRPQSALRFFVRKIASEWNNPTFQSAWIAQACLPQRPLDGLAARLVGRTVTDASYAFLNLVQFAMLAGAIAWVALRDWGDERMRAVLALPLAFVGGFVCHVFWEAKAQYTLPYFVLLIPLATMGYAALIDALSKKAHAARPALICVGATCAVFAVLCAFGAGRYLTFDVSTYDWYVASDPTPRILE